jgi:hypothetical protein
MNDASDSFRPKPRRYQPPGPTIDNAVSLIEAANAEDVRDDDVIKTGEAPEQERARMRDNAKVVQLPTRKSRKPAQWTCARRRPNPQCANTGHSPTA